MNVAAPMFAWIAAAAAVVTVALHLLAWRRPPESPLPTARFAPDAPVRTVSRALRPADLVLLALRVLLVMLVGAALAGVSVGSRANGVARVVVVDRSRGPAASAAIADSARAAFRAGDALVLFDSTAREIGAAALDSIPNAPASESGSLSAALIVAIRAARRLEREHDSVEIVLVSPVARDELDAATALIRRTWPGLVRIVRAGSAAPNDSVAGRPAVRAAPGDPIAAALALVGETPFGATVRVVRDPMTVADTSWAREGHTLVVWPPAGAQPGWQRRPTTDTAFAVTTIFGDSHDPGHEPTTVVAPFMRSAAPPPGRIVARWQDGDPASTEVSLGAGCIRFVGVAVSPVGDLALSPSFRRFAKRMADRCSSSPSAVPVSDSVLAAVFVLARDNDRSGANAVAEPASAPSSRLTTWLLVLALFAAVAEMALRRGATHATA